MPYDYKIDPDAGLLLGHVSGRLTHQEMVDVRHRVLADPEFSPDLRHLIDYSDVTDLDVSVDEFVRLGETSPFGPERVGAFVAPMDSVYGTLRAYLAFADAEGSHTRVFRSMEAARDWLGLD